jgi:hypothetical protein
MLHREIGANHMNFKSSLLAAAVATVTLCAMEANAATPPALNTNIFGQGSSAAVFRGGATVSRGANFLSEVPADQKAGLIWDLLPAPEDVSQEADIYMVVNSGPNWFMRTPSGFVRWDTTVGNLVPYGSAVLSAKEKVVVEDLEALAGISLDGWNFRVHIGYMTNTSPLIYSSAVEFAIANPPANTCPAGTAQLPPPSQGAKPLCVLAGTYTSNLHLTSNFDYLVSGPVFFGGDNVNTMTLTIDAGVKTYGESGADFLRISRGSKVQINGSPEHPVIMTGAAEATATPDTTGLWGGFVVNGNARVNGCTVGTPLCERSAEGNAGTYGGNNDDESSGNINYLQIRYAGFEISPGNELNGLTLNGVGRGTNVDYVHIHNGSDDGFETFGGTVNAKHLVLTGNDDDNVDWQTGWRGKIQHVLVVQKSIGDRGIEADNNNAARDSLPRSKGQIANMTIIGRATNNFGIMLRDGTAANLDNLVIKTQGAGCINIDHGPTFAVGGATATSLTGELTIRNTLCDSATPFAFAIDDLWSTETWFLNLTGNLVGTASFVNGYINSATINARPATSFAGDDYFDQVDYIGAIKDVANDWTQGWTFREGIEMHLPE